MNSDPSEPTPPSGYEILPAEFLREHGAQEGMKCKFKDRVLHCDEWANTSSAPLTSRCFQLFDFSAPLGTMSRVLHDAKQATAGSNASDHDIEILTGKFEGLQRCRKCGACESELWESCGFHQALNEDALGMLPTQTRKEEEPCQTTMTASQSENAPLVVQPDAEGATDYTKSPAILADISAPFLPTPPPSESATPLTDAFRLKRILQTGTPKSEYMADLEIDFARTLETKLREAWNRANKLAEEVSTLKACNIEDRLRERLQKTATESIDLQARLTASESSCAAMREALEAAVGDLAESVALDMDHKQKDHSEWYKAVKAGRAALSSTSPPSGSALLQELAELRRDKKVLQGFFEQNPSLQGNKDNAAYALSATLTAERDEARAALQSESLRADNAERELLAAECDSGQELSELRAAGDALAKILGKVLRVTTDAAWLELDEDKHPPSSLRVGCNAALAAWEALKK